MSNPDGATLHLGGDAYAHPDLAGQVVPIAGVDDTPALTPYPGNPRRGDQDAITSSLRDLGLYRSIIVQAATGHVLAGNHTLRAITDLGGERVPVTWVDVDDTRAAAIVARDNRTSDLGAYDDDALLALLQSAVDDDALLLTGYTDDDLALLQKSMAPAPEPAPDNPSLADRFVIPPFSVLDQRGGAWQERKRRWLTLGIASEIGRGDTAAEGVSGVGPTGERWRENPDQYRQQKGERGGQRKADSRSYSGQESLSAIKPNMGRLNGRTLAQGLQGHRDPDTGELVYTETTAAGVSIFDPVLTELAYRWFSPPGGTVLDPFAGGSVRGIVAAALGRDYVGIELRDEQVQANRVQWEQIGPRLQTHSPVAEPESFQVKVSAASARQTFHGCEPDYIKDVCKGRCCRSPSASTGTGIMVTIHPSEQAAIEARGAEVTDGLLQPAEGEARCPFQGHDDNLCGLHETPDKPFGCIASPFTLNSNGTLIVRNRYRMLCCYKDTRPDGTQLPAYVAFRASLDTIFGTDEAQRISDHLDAGGGDLTATVPAASYRRLMDNDAIKRGDTPTAERTPTGPATVEWVTGDSSKVLPDLDTRADLIFSCPPYADLEVYSDDPDDLSNMAYDDFLRLYRQIIAAAVDRLRDDRFAVWVVGEVRDRRGLYRGLIPDTIKAFTDAGCSFYNEAILVSPVGSLPIRTGRQFAAGRKVGKTHQNVLVFCKGDPRAAADACGPVEVTMPEVTVDADGAQ